MLFFFGSKTCFPLPTCRYIASALPCLVRLVQLPIMLHISRAMYSPPQAPFLPNTPQAPRLGGGGAAGGGLTGSSPLETAAAHAAAALWALVSNPACAPWAAQVAAGVTQIKVCCK